MHKPELRELVAFAEWQAAQLTRAAAAARRSLPSLSQCLRGLEEKLGVRLLTRTTRSVSLTEGGRSLLADLDPVLQGLDTALDALTSFRGGPVGACGSSPRARRR